MHSRDASSAEMHVSSSRDACINCTDTAPVWQLVTLPRHGRGKAPGRGTRYVVWWRYGTRGTQYGGIMVHRVHNMVALWYTGYNSMVDGVRCGCPGSSSGGRG